MPIYKGNHVDIYYEEQGKGDAIVFTHGASWDHRQWEKQIEFFSTSYHTIAWDVRGHGQSSLPPGKVHTEDFNRDLIELLDFLEIERAHLCGLSMGGHISLQTAIRYPERVKSLILIGTPFTNSFNWYEKMFVPINRLSNYFIPMKILAKSQAYVLSKYNHNNKRYIESAVRQIPHKNWLRLWNAISRMESGAHLHKVTCPTLILHGEKDTMTMRQQTVLHEKIKGSKWLTIRNAHHATNLDNPNDVNTYIDAFLKEL